MAEPTTMTESPTTETSIPAVGEGRCVPGATGDLGRFPSLEELRGYFAKDRFATGNGCAIESIEAYEDPFEKTVLREAVCSMPVTAEHLNGRGIAMGGTYFTLGDFAIGVCAYANGRAAVSIDGGIHFIRSAQEGDVLYATARPDKIGHRAGFFTATIRNQDGKTIATVTGSSMFC